MIKKKITKLLSLLILVMGGMQLFSSCSTSKIVYFQDVVPGVSELVNLPTEDLTIRPKDKLSINVNTPDEKLSRLFNLTYGSGNSSSYGSGGNGSSRGLGYTVDTDGNINFPVIGKIRVQGMTREGLAEFITRELRQRELVKDPVVIVEYMNLYVYTLGEVGTKGRIAIDRDNPTILDAISQAGDLTIQGRRDNILVLREENGVQHAYSVDLTNGRKLYNSPVYHLKQNDIIYVEPNKTKVNSSTTNGNTFRSVSFWMSLTSFLTSMAVFVVNL
jgi:polysaccharide export outer membrane protein